MVYEIGLYSAIKSIADLSRTPGPPRLSLCCLTAMAGSGFSGLASGFGGLSEYPFHGGSHRRKALLLDCIVFRDPLYA